MLSKEEIIRRANRLMEMDRADRPVKPHTLMIVAGTRDTTPLGSVRRHENMGPEMQRRLSRAFELVENDQIPDVDSLPKGRNRYDRKNFRLKKTPAPPCKPLMVLDVSRGTPRLVTEFVNPNALPEILFSRVRK